MKRDRSNGPRAKHLCNLFKLEKSNCVYARRAARRKREAPVRFVHSSGADVAGRFSVTDKLNTRISLPVWKHASARCTGCRRWPTRRFHREESSERSKETVAVRFVSASDKNVSLFHLIINDSRSMSQIVNTMVWFHTAFSSAKLSIPSIFCLTLRKYRLSLPIFMSYTNNYNNLLIA